MISKTIAALFIICICILFFPVVIGLGGAFIGVTFGIFGAIFGVIGAIFGAIFGAIGAIFDGIFGHNHFHSIDWDFPGFHFSKTAFALILIGIVLILSRKSKKVKN